MARISYHVVRIVESDNLCWWGSAQMLAQFRGRTIEDEELLKKAARDEKMMGHCSFLRAAGFRVVPRAEMPPAPPRRIVRDPSDLAGAPQVDPQAFGAALLTLLRRRGPLLTLVSWSGAAGHPDHAVIVAGVDDQVGVAKIVDPSRHSQGNVWRLEYLQAVIAYDTPTPMMFLAGGAPLMTGDLPPVEHLKGVQVRLSRLGFDAGPANGVFTDQWKTSVRAFQRSHGLRPDGIPGPRTQGKLKRVYGS